MSGKKKFGMFTSWFLIGIYLFIILFPLFWLVSGSLKTTLELSGTKPVLIPKHIHWDNYIYIWKNIPLARYFRNSLIVATSATILSVSLSAIGAYGFSRFRFPGRRFFGDSLLLTQLFPGITFLIPYYSMFIVFFKITGIRLIGNYAGIIFTMTVFALPIDVWLLKGYVDTIPRELEEAAMIDGCNYIQSFLYVIVPLTRFGSGIHNLLYAGLERGIVRLCAHQRSNQDGISRNSGLQDKVFQQLELHIRCRCYNNFACVDLIHFSSKANNSRPNERGFERIR